jgi:hypothetical protein
MKRESRANLIFLVLFLIISIPGAIILVRKKMDPLSRPMWIPDGRRESMVYIDPTDAPPNVRRFAPAITSLWLADEARARFGADSLATRSINDATATPIVSDNRYFQLLNTAQNGENFNIYLAFWNLPRGEGAVALSITANGQPAQFAIVESPIPAAVKKDLQDSGLPRPPQRIGWVSVALPARSPDILLEFAGTMDAQPFSDRLTIRGN